MDPSDKDGLFFFVQSIKAAAIIAIGRVLKKGGKVFPIPHKHGGSILERTPSRRIGKKSTGKRLQEPCFLEDFKLKKEIKQYEFTHSEVEFEKRFIMIRDVNGHVRQEVLEAVKFFREGTDCVG